MISFRIKLKNITFTKFFIIIPSKYIFLLLLYIAFL